MRRTALVPLWLPFAACTVLPSVVAADAPHAERTAAAEATYAATLQLHEAGRVGVDDVCAWSIRWRHAQKEAGDATAGAAHLARVQSLSAKVSRDVESGAALVRDAHAMRYFLAEAKVWNGEAE